ncbi:MAG TPA: cupredoxin domain-containing protein [Solirubrobacter sp.]|nr:cupredoxin domain-containing protein [Solirubrobacter sp.]
MPVRTRTLLCVLAIAAAGCGETAPVDVPDGRVRITLDEYLIRPQAIRVPAGRPLTITVTNRGRLGHTFRLRAATRNVLAFTTIKPGETRTRTTRRPLAPGTYTMYCALANHEELGMQGTLTVGKG